MVLLEFHYWSDVVMGGVIYIALVVSRILFLIVRDGGDRRIRKLQRKNAALQQKIADLLSGATLPPDVQEKVDLIFNKINANTKKLVKGTTDNTPK